MSGKELDLSKIGHHFPTIKEEALEELRKRMGIKITKTVEPWVAEANQDAIRHYAYGIGDDNPLWIDLEYAQRTRYGTIIAPPCFLYATNRVISGYVGGLPGIHAMFAGTNWTWYLPTRLGDRIQTEVYLKDLVEHQTRFAGRSIQQIYHGNFFNQQGEKMAECDSWCFRTERQTARERGQKYKKGKERKVYSEKEIKHVMQMYADEKVRGGEHRYWEDVQIGDELSPIMKGPMTVTGFIAFVQGWGGLYIRAHKLAFKLFRDHPGVGIPNAYNIPDIPERVHWEEELAKAVGTPGAYDYGPERVSWMSHLMTNWVGDDGWLYKLDAKIVRHNPVGDLLTLTGKVVNKYKEGDQHLVDCELLAVNQDGEHSCEATTTAILPVRKAVV